MHLQETSMNRRTMLTLAAASIAAPTSGAIAQESPDIDGVKAASNAFYTALDVLDDGTAMAGVWAQTAYVTYVGPQSKLIIVGWDAQKKYWADFNKRFSKRNVSLIDVHIHVNGNLAWEIGAETGQAFMADGTTRKIDWLVTNVYEKIGGRWLIVSHHVQPKPQ
jgi:ketosteroid isomerase-like protein